MRISDWSSDVCSSDLAKAQTLRSTALFEVRQRHTDLITQMAVSQQSYAMLGLIGTNNNDLIKGIDRASSTTIAALQTAVVAAQTLANQNLVLSRINGVQARSEEHTSELQSLMRISYAVFCLKKKNTTNNT